jgi:acetolactate synthase-1/2/3 large subunit
MKPTAANILVQSLKSNGMERFSCVAGESYLAVLDSVLDFPEIDVITCRQEGGAAFMAESWGKLTGKPGVCFVTRGPGICNASIGVHTAMQDSTPFLLFMGQVARKDKGKEAFQEIDVSSVFGSMCKWATEIKEAEDIPSVVNKAYEIMLSGRPGPVVIGLPEDMLTEQANVNTLPPFSAPKATSPKKETINELKTLINQANKPLALIGGSGWSEQGINDFAAFVNANHLPAVVSFRRHDLFNHKDNNYVGELGSSPNPKLYQTLKNECDLLLVFGSRLNEITTQGYEFPNEKKQKIVHIHQSEEEINKNFQTALSITGDLNHIAAALAANTRLDGRKWAQWKEELRTTYLDWISGQTNKSTSWDGVDLTKVFLFLKDNLPDDSIVTTDAGNFSGWTQRYLQYGRPGRMLAPICGAMGYATPAAIGASILNKDKTVLGICGDGGFLMSGQELATAIHHKASPIILVCNNNQYGTIKMHQERDYPGRQSATNLTNPSFSELARSYGAFSETIEHESQFEEVWTKALQSNTLSLIEIKMDPKQITTVAAPE